MKITGIVRYIDLEGGFWGIEGKDGKKYLPVNMPEQLKTDGAEIEISAGQIKDMMSIAMWGEAIKIKSFHTLKTN